MGKPDVTLRAKEPSPFLADLGTLNGRTRERYAEQKSAMTTRLAEKTADDKDEKAAEKAWRKAVIKADGKVCRHCKRKVVQQLELAPERLEVHHVAPRVDQAVRYDVRNGVILCATCHGKVTRYELLLVQKAKYLFTVGSKTYINARKPVTFKETK